MDRLRQDLRYAFRALRKRPLFTVVAAASLAIGVGANTTLFSAVNVLLIRPPSGIDGADRVVEIGRTRGGQGFDTFSFPDFRDLRDHVAALDQVSAWRMSDFALRGSGGGERVLGMFVSANYFRALGVEPLLGRAFVPAEDEGRDGHPVVVLSHRLWKRLGSDPGILSKTITLNRLEYTVIGVTPPGFGGHFAAVQPDLWVPLAQYRDLTGSALERQDRGANALHVIGRLAPGQSPTQADAAARALFSNLAERYPETNRRRGARVVPLGAVPGAGRGPVTAFLGVLMGLVGLVLLVTCVNVAGMLLARSAAREKEIAIRVAVGAGRPRLVRQLLTESLAIFLAGGGAGILLAFWGTDALASIGLPIPVPIQLDFRPDLSVLAFALLITLATGLTFGLIPALQTTRPSLVPALKNETMTPGSRGSRLRRAFVAGQVGMSMLLLLAAALFLRSVQAVSEVATGFDPEGAHMTTLELELDGYREAERGTPFVRSLLERLRAHPAISAAAVANDLPLDFSEHATGVIPQDWEPSDEDDHVNVDYAVVSNGYFEALGIRRLRGRDFAATDGPEASGAAIVSRTFVQRVWPNEEAVGRRFRFGSRDGPLLTVIGVVEDVKNQSVTEEPDPFVYLPLTQHYTGSLHLVARAENGRGVTGLPRAIRREVLTIDPDLSLTPVISVTRYTALGTLPQRLAAAIASVLGALALLLSGLGIYGVVAYAVAQRTREIGIRMALGADRAAVLWLILKEGFVLALPGLLVGAPLAVAASLGLRGLIMGVSPFDPIALGGVAGLLAAVIVVAGLTPARRASRVDPLHALRQE